MKNGFDKEANLFGSINRFVITRYQEPNEIVSFELGKRHLMSGYNELWEEIKQNQNKANNILNKIDIEIESLKTKIISQVDTDFKYDNEPDLENIEMKNCYNENLFLEIFNEINNRFGNQPRSLLIGHNPVRKRDGINNNNYWGLFFTYSQYYKDNENPNYFALGTKESIEKLKPTLEKMLDDTGLSNKVKKFNSLEKEFNEVYKTDIFDKIVKIYSTVNTDKLKLKGKCPLCPPHSWIDGF